MWGQFVRLPTGPRKPKGQPNRGTDQGCDVTPGLTKAWTVRSMSDLMLRAMRAQERAAPPWLELLAATSDVPAEEVETAIFGMS